MNFKLFFTTINEEQLIEAKIEWALRHGMEVSVVEGHHPNYKGAVSPDHLSSDETTEILLSYDDDITYYPLGRVEEQKILRDYAYKGLSEEPGIALMLDTDEFLLKDDLEFLELVYRRRPELKLTLTNSLIFLDDKHCAEHIQRKESPPISFNQSSTIHLGEWHERVFRYNKYYGYDRSPFIINDLWGRFIISDSAYFGDRIILPEMYILHYKNFKMEEAKKRHEMYKARGDSADYDEEWKLLEENKFEYDKKHPPEILNVLGV